jgi:hypothetical protein
MAKKGGSDRQARARANYEALKAAGFSAKEAARFRYSSPEKIAKAIREKALPAIDVTKQGAAKDKAAAADRAAKSAKAVADRAAAAAKQAAATAKKIVTPAAKAAAKAAKEAARQEKARANYKALKAAGFSSKEAARFRYASLEKIAKAIREKTLPEVRTKKQARTKVDVVDVEVKKYKSSQLKQIKFETSDSDPHQKRIWDEIRKAKQGHYKYFSVTVTLQMPDGKKHSFSTQMESLKDYRNMDDVMDLIDAAIDYFGTKYAGVDVASMGVDISLNCWKATAA